MGGLHALSPWLQARSWGKDVVALGTSLAFCRSQRQLCTESKLLRNGEEGERSEVSMVLAVCNDRQRSSPVVELMVDVVDSYTSTSVYSCTGSV